MDRKFAEILYSDPFESTQISAERPLDRARSPELRESAGESSLKPYTPTLRHAERERERERERVFRWKGAFIVTRNPRATSQGFYSIFRSRTNRSFLPRFLSNRLGFFNPFTSCPPYPVRPCQARSVARRDPPRSWLEFFIKSSPLDNGDFSCVSRWNVIFIGRDSQTPRAPTRGLFTPFLHAFQLDARLSRFCRPPPFVSLFVFLFSYYVYNKYIINEKRRGGENFHDSTNFCQIELFVVYSGMYFISATWIEHKFNFCKSKFIFLYSDSYWHLNIAVLKRLSL